MTLLTCHTLIQNKNFQVWKKQIHDKIATKCRYKRNTWWRYPEDRISQVSLFWVLHLKWKQALIRQNFFFFLINWVLSEEGAISLWLLAKIVTHPVSLKTISWEFCSQTEELERSLGELLTPQEKGSSPKFEAPSACLALARWKDSRPVGTSRRLRVSQVFFKKSKGK